MMDDYIKNNDEILRKWKEQRPADKEGFVYDGVVDAEEWFKNSGEKILFVLKEAYSSNKQDEWILTNWLCGRKCIENCPNVCNKCWPSGMTYNHVAEAVYMILNPSLGFDEWLGLKARKSMDFKCARKELLKKIAVVNIKKYDGESQSSDKKLKEHIKKHGELLKRQIANISPTVIICGGTYSYFKMLYELEELENEFDGGTMLGNIKVIAAYHPSKQMSSKDKAEMTFKQYEKLEGR